MNWVKANKFLAGFFAIMVVGIGTLGYLLFSAMGHQDTATEEYSSQAAELNRLQNLPLYPNDKNLKVLIAQKKDAVEAIAAFQSNLAARQFPIEPMTPEGFQDKLKATKSAVLEKAAQANVKLVEAPEKFFLGFEGYESRPPDKDAAPALGRELKAIEWIMEQLIANQAILTKSPPVKRDELPEEKGKKAAADKKNRPLVSKFPVQINVKCRQMNLANILNSLTGPKAPQFYILRMIRVKNEKDKGPPRVTEGAIAAAGVVPPPPVPAGVQPPAAGVPAAVPAAAATYIVGEELVEAELTIEIVEFAEPAAAKAEK
jgi:hypothetical protein